MRNLFLIAVFFFTLTITKADTAFRWANSTGAAGDIDNVAFATGEATVFSVLDFDITIAPSYEAHSTIAGAFQIHINDIPTFIDSQNISVAPFGTPAPWEVINPITQTGSERVGSIAYALVVDGGGLSSISVGNFIGQAANSYTITDLGAPPGPTQSFAPGIVVTNVEVIIPEPTTLMALLVGIVGLLGFRRHLQKK